MTGTVHEDQQTFMITLVTNIAVLVFDSNR
jgi:hypothetical protein